MGHVYRCESCGLLSSVVAGAVSFAGSAIHCPLCGGRAVIWTDMAQTTRESPVGVELEEDGCTTHLMESLPESTGENQVDDALTSKLPGLDRAWQATKEVVSQTEKIQPIQEAQAGQVSSWDASTISLPQPDREPEPREVTPLGAPSLAFGDRAESDRLPAPDSSKQSITKI